MVHDPRAPRLAAAATLTAAVAVLFTAINLVGEFLGSPGFSIEEGAALIVAALMLIVAYFANQQREIPALTRATPHTDDAFSDTLVSGTGSSNNNTVNPTTASILNSILGTTSHADQEQVSSAITTLSSGEFGAEVQRTMDAAKAAQQTTIDVREASPAEGETGQTLERVLVKPVPLPGQTAQSLVDPSTIPGLEPGRTFVTDGVASVPLPSANEGSIPVLEASEEPDPDDVRTLSLPAMPDLSQLLAEPPAEEVSAVVKADSSAPSWPDLDDLFDEQPPATSTPQPDLPDLPDLDDLF
ncbi:MAG: hypothetical protein VX330_07170 [Candidatus Thermoplasmatota archaeon]|nr:hypothetical protein [Candidatus Thermoplasmatota archaeon]